ncbi:MAG: DUF262 domain-containing protein [Oscillospiraceae bacterium]|nr:DUF262 domain-containing protein [Oscillospiraceae bacterium]
MKTNDRQIIELMQAVDTGMAQLPDFQRSWVWDDGRIKALIASVIHRFPVGAAMFLEYGNENIRFKYRPIEGAPCQNTVPSELILDGQQRLTSLYAALYSTKPVRTRTDKGKEIERYYYIDIEKALDPEADDNDVIISVPKSKMVTSNFGRTIDLDLSSQDKEYAQKLFPLNQILDFTKVMSWQNGYQIYYDFDASAAQLFMQFSTGVITMVQHYVMPVITLERETSKEAVCRVFENVNTGGVSLTVFELVTAVFAMDDFPLREDWETRQANSFSGDILSVVTATDFLTALALLSSYKRGGTVSCKKKDVLNLSLQDYLAYADALTTGFAEAEKLLQEERIFVSRDLPYTTQLIPLAVLCTLLQDRNQIRVANIKNKIKQWYWCGVFGELYGSANETRYANDIVQVMDWISGSPNLPKTCQEAYFNPLRLLSMQSRQSAAYKGIMALILKHHSQDFISGREMDFTVYKSENVDIHHIFPRSYCESENLPRQKWNSIVNKTPVSYSTNRAIGGVAPSKYLAKIESQGQVNAVDLNQYLESHWIDHQLCRADDFDRFILDRAKKLLDAIEAVTGREITGRDSSDVIAAFGAALV